MKVYDCPGSNDAPPQDMYVPRPLDCGLRPQLHASLSPNTADKSVEFDQIWEILDPAYFDRCETVLCRDRKIFVNIRQPKANKSGEDNSRRSKGYKR